MNVIGGYQLFVHILSNSSSNNVMRMLMLIGKLLCDPYKGPEEPIRDATAGAIILEVLVSTLQVTESISSEDHMNKLIRIAQVSLSLSVCVCVCVSFFLSLSLFSLFAYYCDDNESNLMFSLAS